MYVTEFRGELSLVLSKRMTRGAEWFSVAEFLLGSRPTIRRMSHI